MFMQITRIFCPRFFLIFEVRNGEQWFQDNPEARVTVGVKAGITESHFEKYEKQ